VYAIGIKPAFDGDNTVNRIITQPCCELEFGDRHRQRRVYIRRPVPRHKMQGKRIAECFEFRVLHLADADQCRPAKAGEAEKSGPKGLSCFSGEIGIAETGKDE
jgi:hypothetical protein